jgi:hypothetical protein
VNPELSGVLGKRFAISRTCLVKFDSRFLGGLSVYSGDFILKNMKEGYSLLRHIQPRFHTTVQIISLFIRIKGFASSKFR